MKTAIKAALLASGLALATSAQAQMVTAANPQSIASAMQEAGYKAELTTDDVGDPLIKSRMDGWNVSVLFYDCTNNANCKSLQFFTIFDRPQPMPAEMAIAWSTRNRFGAVGLDNEGDPSLTWDVLTGEAGIPQSVFIDALNSYDTTIARFSNYVFE
ncbi:YbjN domain-containing protein [Alterisphingorhabdus coralli]|uniref:YbjN domain-containing protein n=1 Tax=Alterisphingorhabdus coralli TaxID=3071408 RepID=A0AA97I396_9SPHN|nr:YbjN domain-containing protein [Parasphingorhabdus sp. SCSIO 66989]WOE76550.1 YbjN domain-containing protein [Parasphingorhabdus sp. SCSIO 66989]